MISCPWQTKASISSEMNQREQMGIILFRVEQLSSEGVSFDRVALHVFGPALEVLQPLPPGETTPLPSLVPHEEAGPNDAGMFPETLHTLGGPPDQLDKPPCGLHTRAPRIAEGCTLGMSGHALSVRPGNWIYLDSM